MHQTVNPVLCWSVSCYCSLTSPDVYSLPLFPSVSFSNRLSTTHTNTTSRRCTLSRKTRRRLFCLTLTVRITTPSLWTRTAGHRRPWRSRTCDPDHITLSLSKLNMLPWRHVPFLQRCQWFSPFSCLVSFFLSFINVSKSLPPFQMDSGHYSLDAKQQFSMNSSVFRCQVQVFPLSVLYFMFYQCTCYQFSVPDRSEGVKYYIAAHQHIRYKHDLYNLTVKLHSFH